MKYGSVPRADSTAVRVFRAPAGFDTNDGDKIHRKTSLYSTSVRLPTLPTSVRAGSNGQPILPVMNTSANEPFPDTALTRPYQLSRPFAYFRVLHILLIAPRHRINPHQDQHRAEDLHHTGRLVEQDHRQDGGTDRLAEQYGGHRRRRKVPQRPIDARMPQ